MLFACIFGASLHERGQLLQGLFRAQFIVFGPNAGGNALEEDGDFRSLGRVGEAGGDFHLTGEIWVLRFELNHFDDFLVGDQLDKSALEGIRAGGGLASRRMLRVQVGERHAEGAAFARIKDVHMTLHVIWHAPFGDSVWVEAGLVYGFTGRLDDL